MTKLTAPAKQAKRGRRPADLVIRLRAWVWLAEVQWSADCSLRALDRQLLGKEHEGLRAFWRVKRNGYDPGRERVSLINQSLVHVVAKKPGYEYTQDIYDNSLCLQVLGPTEISFDVRDGLISKLMTSLGLFQPDRTDEFITQEMGLEQPNLLASSPDDYRRSLEALTERRSLDGILLMCLLYRRAMGSAHLEEAICLRDEIFQAVKHYCNRPYFDGQVLTYFLHLINRRVFCGVRDTTPSSEAVEEARQMFSHRRERATSARSRNVLNEMEYMWAINYSIYERRDLYQLLSVDADVAQYLQDKYTLLARSMKRSAARNYENVRRALANLDVPVVPE